MARHRFTEKWIWARKAPRTGRVSYSDVLCPGLQLRISEGDVRSFSALVRVDGRVKRYTLGQFPSLTLKEARNALSRRTSESGCSGLVSRKSGIGRQYDPSALTLAASERSMTAGGIYRIRANLSAFTTWASNARNCGIDKRFVPANTGGIRARTGASGPLYATLASHRSKSNRRKIRYSALPSPGENAGPFPIPLDFTCTVRPERVSASTPGIRFRHGSRSKA